MVMVLNKAAAPLVFNVKGGAPNVSVQRTLLPGDAADLELLVEIDKDPVVKAWQESKLIEVGAKAEESAASVPDGQSLREAQQRAAGATAEVTRLQAEIAAAEMDTNRRTVPRQFSGDGGPAQVPTVDGNGGLQTPTQAEQGRQEPPGTGTVSAVRSPAPRPVAAPVVPAAPAAPLKV